MVHSLARQTNAASSYRCYKHQLTDSPLVFSSCAPVTRPARSVWTPSPTKRAEAASARSRKLLAEGLGGVLGVWLCHVMFDLDLLQASTTSRTGPNQWISEIFATFGLLFVIFGGLLARPDTVPRLVAIYITAAYWFTSSTSLANPAVTIARGFTDTFAGIDPSHIIGFILAQLVGLAVALPVIAGLFRPDSP